MNNGRRVGWILVANCFPFGVMVVMSLIAFAHDSYVMRKKVTKAMLMIFVVSLIIDIVAIVWMAMSKHYTSGCVWSWVFYTSVLGVLNWYFYTVTHRWQKDMDGEQNDEFRQLI